MGQEQVDDARPEPGPGTRFFVGERQVGPTLGGASLAATQMSAGTFVGSVGIHYATGISFLAVWPGIWLGWLVSMLYVGPQLRRSDAVTIPDFLGRRYDDDGADGDRTRALAALVVAAVYLVYTAAQYVAGVVVLETILGVPGTVGTVAIVGLVVAYTAAGGMRASVFSDAVQMLLMLAGLVVATAAGVGVVGGVGPLLSKARATDPALLGWGLPPSEVVGLALAFGLGIAAAPYEMSRVYAMRDARTVRSAIRRSVAMQAVVAVCVATLGLVARVRFPGLASPDAAVPTLVLSMFGPLAGGLLLLAVLAAVLSTVDSVLLVSASALSYDIYATVLRPEGGVDLPFGVEDEMAVTRVATVAAAVVPMALAFRPELFGGLVQLIVALYSALVAGALFAPVVLAVNWDRATTAGGIGGVVAGLVGVGGWHALVAVTGTIGPPLAAVPAVVVGVGASTAAVVGLSVLDS